MYNNKLIASIIIAASLTVPFAASALSLDELQQQLRELLSRVSTLQDQIRMQEVASTTTSQISVSPSLPRFCGIMNRTLAVGQRGDDVSGLQEFLASEGYLNANATGYFGSATQAALRTWQLENGVIATPSAGGSGRLGPATMERIKIRCRIGGNNLLSVSPSFGTAPLTVTVTSRTGDAGGYPPSYVDGQDTLIDFGDGSERKWVKCDISPQETSPARCIKPVSVSHTYEKDGTYVVSIVRSGGMCMGTCPETVLASETVTVGNRPFGCTKEYAPVCGAKPVVCVTTPCNPVPTTYSNSCMMRADNAALLYTGACKDTSINPESDPQCKAWFDGCNSCGRSEPGGPAFCTLKYCAVGSMQKSYCTVYFDDTTANKPPVISGFSGPVALSVNEIGTWKITASDPENRELKYTILWGDEWVPGMDPSKRAMMPAASIQQQTSFTHSYARAGVYNVALTVTDTGGKEARATASVTVSQTSCTQEYAPVCGRPQGCANTCAPGMYCAMVCQQYQPQTYGSRCQMNNANADFIHEGMCTAASPVPTVQ